MRAYFRGVPFDIETNEESIGFYSKVFEPISGEPWVEILGTKPKEYPIQGFFVGHDAKLRRDLFLSICQDKRPGTLLHPSFGMRDVFCTELTLSETSEKKNMISFKATFRDAPKSELGIAGIVSDLFSEKKTFLLSQIANFTNAFSIVNESFFAASQAKDLIATMNQAMTSETGAGLFAGSPRRGAESIRDFESEITTLIHSPERLAALIFEGLSSMSRTQTLRFIMGFLDRPMNRDAISVATFGLVFASSLGVLTRKDIAGLTMNCLGLFSGESLRGFYKIRTLALSENESQEKSIEPTNAILAAFKNNQDPEEASQISQKTGQVFSVAWLP